MRGASLRGDGLCDRMDPTLHFLELSPHAMVGIDLMAQVVLFGSLPGPRQGPQLDPQMDPKGDPKRTPKGYLEKVIKDGSLGFQA